MIDTPPAIECPAPVATDGDSIRCGPERIRLLAVDAPEMPGSCRQGRACVPGDPFASRDTLRGLLRYGPVRIVRVGVDRFGRTLAIVYAGRVNLSCAMVGQGAAVYVARWDNGGRIAAACPSVAR